MGLPHLTMHVEDAQTLSGAPCVSLTVCTNSVVACSRNLYLSHPPGPKRALTPLPPLAELSEFLSQLSRVNEAISTRAFDLAALPTITTPALIAEALSTLPRTLPPTGLGLQSALLSPRIDDVLILTLQERPTSSSRLSVRPSPSGKQDLASSASLQAE